MAAATKRRRRLVAGCERCRARHFRCDTDGPACSNCIEAGAECERSVNVRFRDGLDFAKDHEVAFPESNAWPHFSGSIHFHDETLEVKRLYTVEDSQSLGEPEDTFNNPREINKSPVIQAYQSPQANGFGLRPQQAESSGIAQLQEANFSPSDVLGGLHEPSFAANNSPEEWSGLPSQVFSFTEREAVLMRNFIDNMALWADITDPQRHFEIHVPARAVQEPVLRSAIFAFSSRHIDRQTGGDTAEALQYHNHCLQMLIPALSGSRENITEVLLAAVAILRQHEEMDCEDNQFHLTGITHILNTVSSFGSSGGLGEAAAWLCLRQDIYISLTSQKPLRTNLQNFDHSDTFGRNDDFAWASRMVFLLAKVLKCAFSYEVSTAHLTMLQDIEAEVETWYSTKPHTFNPIRFISRGQERDCRFPSIWMLLPVHVVGLQYYHIAKIVLAVSSCPSPGFAYESLKHSRNIEKTIRNHLLTVLGLAKSNTKAENTLFTARHSLATWGWVLRHELDQEAAEILLRDMEMTTGWNMTLLIQSLREQWHEENSDS